MHPWWWRQYAPLKRRPTIILHRSTSQQTILSIILAAVRTLNLTNSMLLWNSKVHYRVYETSPLVYYAEPVEQAVLLHASYTPLDTAIVIIQGLRQNYKLWIFIFICNLLYPRFPLSFLCPDPSLYCKTLSLCSFFKMRCDFKSTGKLIVCVFRFYWFR
jgi:hypothetical protein